MSLLEKASGGQKAISAQSQARTSLFTRAMAATREKEERIGPDASTKLPDSKKVAEIEIETALAALPPYFDSILAAWSIISSRLPIDAIALFLPQGDFLSLAAQSGFPSGTEESIPVSLAPSSQKNNDLLGDEAKALIAPSLGVGIGMKLRATAMWSDIGLAGLWIYCDESLERTTSVSLSRLGNLLSRVAAFFPTFSMALIIDDPVSTILEKTRKYRFVAAFRFDLSKVNIDVADFRGLQPNALRSSFLSACVKMLSQIGAALIYGESSVVCILGSSSPVDPQLALFQFSKTLKRTLPFLTATAFPQGFAIGFDPSSDRAAREELSRFLAG